MLQTFNIAYDEGVFPSERHRIQLSGCYLLLAFTGARPAEIVDNEKKRPKDGTYEDLFGPKSIRTEDSGDESDMPVDDDSRLLEDMLYQQTVARGRPKALCYEDICLSVVRHPQTGIDVLTMAVKFIHHKGADRKPKPSVLLTSLDVSLSPLTRHRTIFFFSGTRRLLFCIITVIVSIAISDEAFDAPSLTSATSVFRLRNCGSSKCTALRWKEKWLKRPIFRGFDGSALSEEKPLPYHKLNDDMERQTLEAGFEKALGPKAFRRGAANAANGMFAAVNLTSLISNMGTVVSGNASDAVRDQMMRHDPRWATFNGAYINEKVEFHLERVVAGEPTDDCLIDLFAHMSLTRDPDAGRDMVPDEVWQSLEPDPEILELEAQRDKLKNGRYRIRGTKHEDEVRQLTKTIRTKKAQRDKSIRQSYRQYYFYHRPTWDIEQQFAGGDRQVDEASSVPAIDLHIPERAQLANLLCQEADDLDFDRFLQRRIEAAELMVSLTGKRETAKRKRIVKTVQSSIPSPVADEAPEPDRFPLLMGKAQCPRCIGDETMSMEERTFAYCRPAVMNDHFDREHLATMEQMERDDYIGCTHPKCKEADIKLHTVDHFRNHVATVHGVALRRSPR